jgi:proteasome component ECM29
VSCTQAANSDEILIWLLDEIIKVIPEPHTYSRQASSIWLLALVKNCSMRAPVLDRRQILQLAFTDLLSEDSEIVQDVASRGLGIIFSISDVNTQEYLSNSLLEQLTGGRKDVKKVNEDTKVFEEGVLGKAPTGLVYL